ncbi:MAG: MBL fold metallo-hydrolase [Acidimicrobiales bacterium]
MTSITFLGTGNFLAPAVPVAPGASGSNEPGAVTTRYWNGFVLDSSVLVEVPPTALPHLRRCGFDAADLEAVVISHFHPDHSFGWPFLLFEMLRVGRTRPLSVVGPPGVARFLSDMMQLGALTNPHTEAHEQFELDYVEVDGRRQSAGELSFRAFEVEHVSNLRCYGYVFERGGRHIGYSGDTRPCAGLDELATSCEVLVLECNSTHPVHSHMDVDAVAELHRRFPDLQIILTHLGAEVASKAPPGVSVPEDFETMQL